MMLPLRSQVKRTEATCDDHTEDDLQGTSQSGFLFTVVNGKRPEQDIDNMNRTCTCSNTFVYVYKFACCMIAY